MSTIADPRDIIVAPVISEKSYSVLDQNWYTFLVHPDANKTQIKIAIQQIFNVRVLTVNTANREPDQAKRYAMLSKAEAYLLDAAPIIPLTKPATSWMKKPYVKGLYPNPGTLHAWKFVYIEHDPAKWDQGMPDMTNAELAEVKE